MVNKFEILGIGISVCIMALALFLLRLESDSLISNNNVVEDQPAVVFVAQDGDRNEEVFSALVDSMDDKGNVEKLLVDDVVVGTGPAVEIGDTVTVDYVGTLQNGQEFDNSKKNGQPFTFSVGAGSVIEGWDQGLVGMKVGGQRILVIPPDMAYGRQGIGPIPGNATLVFSIELLEIN